MMLEGWKAAESRWAAKMGQYLAEKKRLSKKSLARFFGSVEFGSQLLQAEESSMALPAYVEWLAVDYRPSKRSRAAIEKMLASDPVALRVHVRNSRDPVELGLAVGVMRSDGTLCFAHSTQMEGTTFDFEEGFVTLVLDSVKLLSGEFTLPIWLLDAT